MSRTDLDPVTLARSLRRMAGDGSIEWVVEPIQARVLLDVADALDENDKLRELVKHLRECVRHTVCALCPYSGGVCDFDHDMRELGIEVDE